ALHQCHHLVTFRIGLHFRDVRLGADDAGLCNGREQGGGEETGQGDNGNNCSSHDVLRILGAWRAGLTLSAAPHPVKQASPVIDTQPARRAALLRSCSFRWRLRRRSDSGVTSMSSSSLMNASACSSVKRSGGESITLSSLPAARMLVSC